MIQGGSPGGRVIVTPTFSPRLSYPAFGGVRSPWYEMFLSDNIAPRKRMFAVSSSRSGVVGPACVRVAVTGAVVLETLYWICAVCVAYPYALYPAVLAVWSKFWARPVRRSLPGERLPSVSVVISVYNEEANIGRRVREWIRHILDANLDGEIVVVSDGSTDKTAEVARSLVGGGVPVVVLDLSENIGKAAAISEGCMNARNEIIALGDVRQTWAADALPRLLENFADPDVGAVGGELFIETAPGVMAGVGLYWRYEKWLRRLEGLVHSTVGVTGAISAVRRRLFRPIMPGTVLDDVYWPLEVAMRGGRVVFDGRAKAFDRLPDHVQAEFRRKVRTLAGNFQVCARLPHALVPWHNPVWFTLVSHKLMRLVVPWALIATAGLSAALGGPLYHGLLGVQMFVTLVALLGMTPFVAHRSRTLAALGSFLILNAAAWLGFWVWITGKTARSWTKTTYRVPAAHALPIPVSTSANAPSFEGAGRWG